MDVSKILDLLHKGADLVETLAPIAVAFGGPLAATAVAVVKTVSDTVENVQQLAKDGKVVFDGRETAEIDAILKRIAAANDKLNEAIVAS